MNRVIDPMPEGRGISRRLVKIAVRTFAVLLAALLSVSAGAAAMDWLSKCPNNPWTSSSVSKKKMAITAAVWTFPSKEP